MVEQQENSNYKPIDSTDNLQFQRRTVKFYDEDLKKMESMNLRERVEYKAKLKVENRYTYVLEEDEDE